MKNLEWLKISVHKARLTRYLGKKEKKLEKQKVKMLPKEFERLNDGLIGFSKKNNILEKIIVNAEIDQHYTVEEKPFAR